MLKGEDKILKIALTDPDNDNAPIDPDSYAGFIVVIYEQPGQHIAQFSKVTNSEFDDVQNIDSANGTFELFLKRSVFAKYLKKKLKGEVKVAETNADFEDNIFVTIEKFEFDILEDCESGNIDVPVP